MMHTFQTHICRDASVLLLPRDLCNEITISKSSTSAPLSLLVCLSVFLIVFVTVCLSYMKVIMKHGITFTADNSFYFSVKSIPFPSLPDSQDLGPITTRQLWLSLTIPRKRRIMLAVPLPWLAKDFAGTLYRQTFALERVCVGSLDLS